MTNPSVAYRRNRSGIWNGVAPEKYMRLLPHIIGAPVVEIGAAEGVLSLLLAVRGRAVKALELREARHQEAKLLQARWKKLGLSVDGCEMLLGDIRERYDVLDGAATVVAVRSIYYLREDVATVFAEIGRRGVKRVVLCGNRNRAARFVAGVYPPGDGLGTFNIYASATGMTEALAAGGYRVTATVSDGDPIVVGERE